MSREIFFGRSVSVCLTTALAAGLLACSSSSGSSSPSGGEPGEGGTSCCAGGDGGVLPGADSGGFEAGSSDSGSTETGTSHPDGSTSDAGGPGDPTGVVATSADIFLSSLGVNTHIDQGYDATQYVMPLQFTGIRNIRDGEGNLSSTVTLHQQTGVLVNILTYADLTGIIAAAKTLAAAGALLSLEGCNEPNNFPITYNGQMGGGSGTWVPVAQYQRDLFSAVKGDATLGAYPVFSASEDGAETDNVGLQFLTIPAGSNIAMPDGTKYADYANPHNYVIGNAGTYVDNVAWQAADPTLNSTWDGLYGEYGITWAKHYQGYSDTDLQTLPRVTTETGWDSTNNPGGEHVQGVVLVNTYLAQFKRSWRYTFIYELVDEQGSTGDQGLYHTDFTPKQSATFIHNMTTVLADTTVLASPGHLNYTIANEPSTVHDLLLQKSTGTFELIVWDENATGNDNVTVDLTTSRKTVNVYDVTTGVTATQTLSNVSSVPLMLSDHALILEIP